MHELIVNCGYRGQRSNVGRDATTFIDFSGNIIMISGLRWYDGERDQHDKKCASADNGGN